MAPAKGLSELSVLVIDDEIFMLDVIYRALRGVGIAEVTKAGDAPEAIDLSRDGAKFDCIIADFNMKPMNGLQFLQRIRSNLEPGIPARQTFVMLTGNAQQQVVACSLALDVNAYLVKPVAALKLKAALERAITSEWTLRNPEYYQAIDIGVADVFNNAEDKRRRAPIAASTKKIIQKAADTPFIDRTTKVILGPRKPRVAEEENAKEPIIASRRCSLEKLKEKMVLAEDIQADDGKILVGSGTSLSAKMIDRLRTVAKDRKFVLVQKRL